MFALLSWIPGIAAALSRLSGWLLMRKWGAWLLFFVGTALFSFLQKVVTFAGVMLVANEYVMPELLDYISGPMLSLPEMWLTWFRILKVDQAVTIILSATLARAAASIQFAKNPQSPNWTTTGP